MRLIELEDKVNGLDKKKGSKKNEKIAKRSGLGKVGEEPFDSARRMCLKEIELPSQVHGKEYMQSCYKNLIVDTVMYERLLGQMTEKNFAKLKAV